MTKNISKLVYPTITFTLLASIFTSCSTVKKVAFPSLIDTSNKIITFQKKQIYNIEPLGVYASNNFSGGKLNNFEQYNDSTITATIQPENTPINDSPYYSFKLWSDNPKSVYINLKYPVNYKHRYHPKIKNKLNTWQPLDSFHIVKKGNNVFLKLDITKDTTWISAQEVVSYKDTKQWISTILSNNQLKIHLNSAGMSQLGKNIPVLDIYSNNNRNKDIVVLLTRQHPPEVTGYFAFQHFISTLLEKNELSEQFFAKYRVIAFPIINPDGADLGHWRHNANGVDLNRDWSQYNQPEILSVVKYLNKTLKENKTKILIGLDFHSTWNDVFYTNEDRASTILPNFLNNWFKALEDEIPNYIVNEQSNNSQKPVSKGWFLKAHNAVGITYEIGDETPRARIEDISVISAREMMKTLLGCYD